MKNMVKFEVCGLYFVLWCATGRGRGGYQYQLSDEAFSCLPFRFNADCEEELFAALETYIAIDLSERIRNFIMTELGSIGKPGGVARGYPRDARAFA